jgi:uncharacterized protein YcfJ
MDMKSLKITLAVALMVTAGIAAAGGDRHGSKKHGYTPRHDLFEYAKVVEVQPIYREVRVSTPVRECWDEPVYHTRQAPKSAGGMLAGGLIGGIVGHQIGRGDGNRVATAVGALVGAHIGHQAVNGHMQPQQTLEGYEEHCKTRERVSYEEVVDGYDVTYKYRGREYNLVMPYDPGRRIKMRIQFTPVI